MKLAIVLATGTLCGAIAVRPPPATSKETFKLFSFEKAKADAERLGVFKPQPDRPNAHNRTANGKVPAAAVDLAAAGTCDNPEVHVEWRDMNDGDRNNYIGAVNCLLGRPSAGGYPGSQSRYEDLVSVHQQLTPNIHMVGQFLPWHRYFLWVYESILRSECGYGGPMPWWDESKDAGHMADSPLFRDQWFGPVPQKGGDGSETCIWSGFPRTIHIGPGGGFTDRCLARALDDSLTAQCTNDFSNYCNSYGDYASMESCAEGGPHAYCHNGIGGTMSDVASSVNDPVFFLHHSFIDRNWRLWQNADSARLSQVGGNTRPDGSGPQLDLNYVLTSNNLRYDFAVRDVMDTQGSLLCYVYSY